MEGGGLVHGSSVFVSVAVVAVHCAVSIPRVRVAWSVSVTIGLGLTLNSSSFVRNEDSSHSSAGNILRKHRGILTEDTRGRGGGGESLS